jgi:lipopolysaccharide export system permease protein
VVFQRSLLREFASYAAAVLAVLFAIVITSALVRLLARAAGGQIPSDAILALIGFAAVNALPILIALTLFVSVLMAVSRSYRDSEMVVWSASGLSLVAWVRPVLAFAAPLVVLTAVLAWFLTPWANDRAAEFLRTLENREDVSRIAPGVFRESGNAENVVRNVFIASNRQGRIGVTVSREGLIENAPNGDRFAVLLKGRRYEGVPGTEEYRVFEFDRFAQRITTRELKPRGRDPKTVPLFELMESTAHEWRAELMWRLGQPLLALNLALFAIPIAFVNPRASRSVNLIFAVLAYFAYSNLLGITKAFVAQGKLEFHSSWWVLHAAMFALTMLLFVWRNTLGFRLWRAR